VLRSLRTSRSSAATLPAPLWLGALPGGAALLVVAALLTLAAMPAVAVVRGTPTSRARFPFFAVVGGGCGGALIRPNRVLSAAHCSNLVGEHPVVRVGPRNELRHVRLIALSAEYVRWQKRAQREFPPGPGDLMLIELDRPVTDVAPVVLAMHRPRGGARVVTIGRGANNPKGGGEGIFRHGTVQVVPNSSCQDQLPDALTRVWSICTRDPRSLRPGTRGPFVSACFGDSGGPLLVGRVEVGVVSWGPACGSMRDPEIYANVARGRGFALASRPVWAPRAAGRPRIAGAARVGHTVACDVKWVQRPTTAIYLFLVAGRQAQESTSARFRVPATARGKLLACDASGATAGGRYGSPLSPTVRVTG
jgi:hypothetical protein